MPAYIDQSVEQFHNRISIANLPVDINAKEIREIFGQFGMINRFYLKRRLCRDSPVLLSNPFVVLIFEERQSIDQIMSARPYFLKDHELLVRRCLPITRRYPYESHLITNKMLVRIPQENHEEILPKDDRIRRYFQNLTGEILRLERLEEQTVLIEFDDYNSVDVCCLSRPHSINHQILEVEKCTDEHQARRRALFRQKTRSRSLKFSLKSTVNDPSSRNTFIDEQMTQLQLTYDDRTDLIEDEHQRGISSLKSQLEQIIKERIRFQRLTRDYQQDQNRLLEENHRWRDLLTQNFQEQSRVQHTGQDILLEATNRYSTIVNHLFPDNQLSIETNIPI